MAFNEVDEERARAGRAPSSAHTWTLESSDDSDSELMKGSATRREEKDKDKYNTWCIQICCQSVFRDMASVYVDFASWLQCRAPPTLKCTGLACCVLYCGLMAAGVLALAFLTPTASYEYVP